MNDFGIQYHTSPAVKLERYQNSIYYIGYIYKGSWYQAMQFCKYHNMDLVSIETQEENEFLSNQMKTFFGGGSEYWFWTSGTTLSNNHWVWMNTGRPIVYANWFPNQPDNAGSSEHCLEARYIYTNTDLKWNDNNCEGAQLHFICEAPVSTNVSAILSTICTASNSGRNGVGNFN